MDSVIREDIEKANMEIKTLNLLTEESVPEDAACLMINSPASDISIEEKDAILSYLENGGKAMISLIIQRNRWIILMLSWKITG